MKKIIVTTAVIVFSMAIIAYAAPDSNSIVKDDIEYYMQTDKHTYHSGENVEMLYRVTNLGNEDVRFDFSDQVQYYFEVKDNTGEVIWFKPKVGFPAFSYFVLQPNEYKEYSENWDMLDNQGILIAADIYNVTGSLHPILLSQTDKDKYVPVSVPIEIIPPPATTYYVNPGQSIQAVIDNLAVAGDEVHVNPGTYYEKVTMKDGVDLRSTGGPDVTIIDGNYDGSVITVADSTVIDGFTITHGTGTPGVGTLCPPFLGGGIYSESNSYVTISNNIIKENILEGVGFISGVGAGIWIYNGSYVIIENNLIVDNAALSECRGYGGGIAISSLVGITVRNNTLVNNTADVGGGILVDKVGDLGGPIVNCIVWDSKTPWGDGDDLYGVNAIYSNIMDGDQGEGNISEDPLFVDPCNGDYHLLPDSPCIDAGDPCYIAESGETDLDGKPRVIGGRIDMGAYEFQEPPDCSGASPSIGGIWPSNHKWVEVGILGVTDLDGDPIVIIITGITQDEPVVGQGSGHTCPDGDGIGTSFARVRAERSGQGNGRVYEISFEAHDGSGGVCNGTVQVCVPHDKGNANGCVDDGQIYDSTASGLLSADLNRDGSIGYLDLVTLTEHWLKDEPSTDIAPTGGDNIVNFMDWAVLTRYWLTSYELDY